MPELRCVILGGGGHAGVVIDALEAAGGAAVHGILDSDASLWNQRLHGHRVLGGDALLGELAGAGVRGFVVGVGSVARNPARQRLYRLALEAGLQPHAVIHPSAVIARGAQVGRGTVVLAGAIVNPGARIGDNAIINSGAIIEHGCTIGDHAHVASGARLSGRVQVGVEAFVGAGATVKQGVIIAEGAVIGAGAVVLHDVARLSVVAGVPARLIKR